MKTNSFKEGNIKINNIAIESYEQARSYIRPNHREDFDEFVITGKASKEFKDYMDSSSLAQEAITWCAHESIDQIRRVVEDFNKAFPNG